MVNELVEPGVEIAEKGPDFERRVGEEVGIRNGPPRLKWSTPTTTW